jgi:hypothetical protein
MRKAFLFLLVGLFFVADVEAADIRLARSLSGTPLPGITVEGALAPGDYQKLVALALSSRGAHTVWLASPGGNLSEALRMGRFIRSLGFTVTAPSSSDGPLVALKNRANNTCSSSCFLLYAAGVSRQGTLLGLHRPSLPADEYFSLGLEGAAAAHRVIREAVAGYLEEMGVPSKYTSLMLSTNASDMVWLSVEDIRNDLDGVIAEYADHLRDTCPRRTRPESGESYRPVRLISSSERLAEEAGKEDVDCVSARLQEMHEERRQAAAARLFEER